MAYDSVDTIIKRLRKETADHGAISKLARECNVTPGYLRNVIRAKMYKTIDPRVLRGIGYDPTIYYKERE
jgi:hypothetical protein